MLKKKEERRIYKEKAITNSRKLVKKMLNEFEKDFMNWESNPTDFKKLIHLGDFTGKNYYLSQFGYNEFIYPLERSKVRYSTGEYSYDINKKEPYDMKRIFDLLTELCYEYEFKVQEMHLTINIMVMV